MKNLLACLAILTSLVFTSCEKNGPITTQTRTFDSFTGVSVQSAIDVNIEYGTTQSVVLKAPDNLLDKMDLYVDNGTLIIKMKVGIYNTNELVVDVVIPTIDFAEVTGSGDMWVGDFANLNDVWMKVTGSGNIKTGSLGMTEKTLTMDITGSGDIKVNGEAKAANVKVTGSGDCDAYGMLVASSDTKVTGSGNVKLNVTNDLNVTISGSGDVYYKGNPTVNVSITGSGDLVHTN